MSVQAPPKRQGSRGTLILFFVILLFAAAIVVLLSHSRMGYSGIERDRGPDLVRSIPRDQPIKGTPTGEILIGVTDARVQGNPRYPASLYCAISISALNGVNRQIQNLVLGFDFTAPNDDTSSGNVSFSDLDPDTLGVSQHHVAKMVDCRGLTGKVTVVACIIDPGIDCKARVRTIQQGIVRLE